MRRPIYEWVQRLANQLKSGSKILDVGSRDVAPKPGMQLRQVFQGHDYLGIDMVAGESVDMVLNAHDMLSILKPRAFDCVCCCEVFEHDPKFWITLRNCRIVLKPGGLLILSAAGIQDPIHECPVDCYRFLPHHLKSYFKDYKDVSIWGDTKSRFVAGCGRKPYWMHFLPLDTPGKGSCLNVANKREVKISW